VHCAGRERYSLPKCTGLNSRRQPAVGTKRKTLRSKRMAVNTYDQSDYLFPAEWEPHEATWLAWPHKASDWPGKLPAIHWVYGEIVRKLAVGEKVHIVVDDPAVERRARSVLTAARADMTQVEFFRFSTDRGWMRDSGPIFLRRAATGAANTRAPALSPSAPSPSAPSSSAISPAAAGIGVTGAAATGAAKRRPKTTSYRQPQHQHCGDTTDSGASTAGDSLVVADFHFNGWAKYADWKRDRLVPRRVSRILGLPLVSAELRGRKVVLEGGGVDVNGRGTVLTTEECYLDQQVQVRNPGFTRDDYQAVFRRYLGASNVLWLGRGIAGDDTHGHVDDVCRFVGPSTVVLCQCRNRQDPDYRALEENFERLQDYRLEDGRRVEIVRLPMPEPLYWRQQRLPASYANFYIANAVVLVPTFNDPADRQALGILAELFADRTVVGIHAGDLVLGLGTLHCLTQQQPCRQQPRTA